MSPSTKASTGAVLFVILGLIEDSLASGVLEDFPPEITTIGLALISLIGMYFMPERNPSQSAREIVEQDVVEYLRDVEEDQRRQAAESIAQQYQQPQWADQGQHVEQVPQQPVWQQPAPGGAPSWQQGPLERPGERQVRQQRGSEGYPYG